MELGFCISDWGVLKFWDVYNQTNVDFFTTMSMTYYGRNVARNREAVKDLLENIDVNRIQIGLKSQMYHVDKRTGERVVSAPSNSKYRHKGGKDKRSHWNETSLNGFVSWLRDDARVRQLTVWPETWDKFSKTMPYFYEVLDELYE